MLNIPYLFLLLWRLFLFPCDLSLFASQTKDYSKIPVILFSKNILSISFKHNLNLEIQTHWNGGKWFVESLVFPFHAAAALWHSSLSEEYSSGWHSLTHTAHLKRVDPYSVRLTDSPHIINGLHSQAVLLLLPFPGAVSVVPAPHTLPTKWILLNRPSYAQHKVSSTYYIYFLRNWRANQWWLLLHLYIPPWDKALPYVCASIKQEWLGLFW